MDSKRSHILILGGGAWGLSSALHLLNAGYTNITVLERAKTTPSLYSAAHDLNKIVRAEYDDPFYTDLALEAIEGWKTPLFGPYYHETGYVNAVTGRAPTKAKQYLEKALASIEKHPSFSGKVWRLDGPNEFKDRTWQYTGPLSGFNGYFNRLAGYAHSSNALHGIWRHCVSRGVRMIHGESAGRVAEIVVRDGRCTGARTADGRIHNADLVISALGAQAASVIPEIGDFVVARAWSVAHIQLSDEEADLLRGIPTTNIRDLGFFFEPDPKTRLFKLCPLGAGFTNPNDNGISLPPLDRLPPPQDFIPREDEVKLRQLLRETFPWMASRPFVEQKLCWFADTHDSNYCIDYVPGMGRSLICLSGDSGHGFKMMPTFGKWVVELIEARIQTEPRWQWRDKKSKSADWDSAVSWRIGQGAELKDLIEAKVKLERARL